MDASSTSTQVITTATDMRVTHVFNPCSLLCLHAPVLGKVILRRWRLVLSYCARELLSELKCADAGISCRLIRSSLCLVHVHRERAAKPTVREHWTSDRRATISAACLLPSAFCKQRAGTGSHSHPRFLYKWWLWFLSVESPV